MIKQVNLPEGIRNLARKIFIKLISFEDVDTIAEMDSVMDDAIDLAIEFDFRLRHKTIPAKEAEEAYCP